MLAWTAQATVQCMPHTPWWMKQLGASWPSSASTNARWMGSLPTWSQRDCAASSRICREWVSPYWKWWQMPTCRSHQFWVSVANINIDNQWKLSIYIYIYVCVCGQAQSTMDCAWPSGRTELTEKFNVSSKLIRLSLIAHYHYGLDDTVKNGRKFLTKSHGRSIAKRTN